jgi:hypothetical protein
MPKSGHTAPAKRNPGAERKANMKGAATDQPSGGLKRALSELKSQNHSMGHLRHEPLAGLKPRSGNSNY